ncbi:hypothetical protein [Rothia sp. CCM 9416]|uniref:hypothetical protein n=1 Tax=Rothia sp. CCM 9416 TaxID=3402655 RepID=UPI003AE975EE
MSSKETFSGENVCDSFSLPRMEPFRQEAKGDVELALKLYAWNAQMVAASLEQISYLEVLLRNAIDKQLAKEVKEDKNGIPWFLLHPYNTVAVPATDDWPFYEEDSAYICQAGRYFQEVKHIAFYADKEIKPNIPCIVARYDNVEWNEAEANRLVNSGNREYKRLGQVMRKGLEAGRQGGRYQVFILTREGDPRQVSLSSPFVNKRTGKGSAFVQRQRYTSVHQLRHAQDIWEL